MNQPVRYSFSFITGALFVPESLAIISLLAQGRAWPEIQDAVIHDNLLKTRTASSRNRIFLELKRRLSTLSTNEIRFLASCDNRDLRVLLFIASCRHYAFIRQFVVSTLLPKMETLDFQIRPSDYSGFVHHETQEHPEIATLTDKSRAKIREVIFRMLAEASLIESTRNPMIKPVFPSAALMNMIAKTNSRQLCWLLISDRYLPTK